MREALIQSLENLRAHKLRSVLTMFGIVWGVVSIVILSAMSEGFQRGNLAVLEELGKNIVIIRNGRTSLQAGGERAGRIVRLTIGDARALAAQARLIEHVSPELMRGAVRAKSPYNVASLQVSGVWPVFQTIRTIEVSDGRPLNPADSAEGRRVALIGHEASRLLFDDRNPVGTDLMLDGLAYRVIGRVRKKFQDSNYTGQDDYRLFVPYEAMRRDFPLPGRFDTPDSLSAIIVSAHQRVADDLAARLADSERGVFGLVGQTPVQREIRAVLAPRHRFEADDVEAVSMWDTGVEAVMFSRMVSGMRQFFVMVSLITLALGGIGVMNIMLVAVRERTREIGLRKALGATPAVIERQFLVEGMALTLVSGLAGFLGGYLLCRLINLAPLPARFSGMIVTPGTAAFSVAALTAVGVAAALYPASRAAALPPVEALRYD